MDFKTYDAICNALHQEWCKCYEATTALLDAGKLTEATAMIEHGKGFTNALKVICNLYRESLKEQVA